MLGRETHRESEFRANFEAIFSKPVFRSSVGPYLADRTQKTVPCGKKPLSLTSKLLTIAARVPRVQAHF